MYRVSGNRAGPWKIGKCLAQMGAAAGRRGTAKKLSVFGKKSGTGVSPVRRAMEKNGRDPCHSAEKCQTTPGKGMLPRNKFSSWFGS
jgi:hypothetical protein